MYANLSDKTSTLRTDYTLYLYKREPQEETKLGHPEGNMSTPQHLQKSLTMKIGGFAGLGSSDAKSVISLEKTRFQPGEKIKVLIDMDNTNCKKAVKSYKIKLQRKVQCNSGKSR